MQAFIIYMVHLFLNLKMTIENKNLSSSIKRLLCYFLIYNSSRTVFVFCNIPVIITNCIFLCSHQGVSIDPAVSLRKYCVMQHFGTYQKCTCVAIRDVCHDSHFMSYSINYRKEPFLNMALNFGYI